MQVNKALIVRVVNGQIHFNVIYLKFIIVYHIYPHHILLTVDVLL